MAPTERANNPDLEGTREGRSEVADHQAGDDDHNDVHATVHSGDQAENPAVD